MNERRVDTFSPPPAMIPERIGTIGNTQGVKASSNPVPKNPSRTRRRLPLRILSAQLSCSDGAQSASSGALFAALAAVGVAGAAAAAGRFIEPSAAATVTSPSFAIEIFLV